jgi:uncharacterized phage protein (TIGR02218 family)
MKSDFTSATSRTNTTLYLARCFAIHPVVGGASAIGPFYFTDHDAEIVVSGQTPSEINGTYTPVDSVNPSSMDNESNMAVDNMEIVGHIRASGVEDADVKAGLFDGSEVWVFVVDWKLGVTTGGYMALRRGWLGNIRQEDSYFTMEIRGLTQKLGTQIGEMYTAACPADFCDARCTLPIATYTQADTVTTPTPPDKRTFTVTTATGETYKHGHIKFLTGLNAGLSQEIKSWTSGSKLVKTFIPFPFTISVGDTLNLYAGCAKTLAACKAYSNVVNFRGFPHVPHQDEAFRTPNAIL